MKKRILSIALCICLMVTLFNVFEYHFEIPAKAATRTLKCTCTVGGTTLSDSHYYYCELFCRCTYYDGTTSLHAEGTCNAFSCANAEVSGQWRGCTHHDDGTTPITIGTTTYNAKGHATHVNTCMKFKQVCAGLSGCNGSDTPNADGSGHVLGCPLYTVKITDSNKLTPQACDTCGWLFGEHYIYCTNSKNTYYYNKLSEVTNRSVYIPGDYTRNSNNINITIPVSQLEATNSSRSLGLSASDIEVLKKAVYWDSNDKVITDDTKKLIQYRRFDYKNPSNGSTSTNGPIGDRDIHIPEGVVCVIDLNGTRVWGHGTGPVITNYGTLIILDSYTTKHTEGTLVDRGYYFYDDDAGKYYHSIRNAEDAVWRQGVNSGEAKASIYGGYLYNGRTTRNIVGSYVGYKEDGTAATIQISQYDSNKTLNQGTTYDQLLARSGYRGKTVAYSDANRRFFTYLVENNQLGKIGAFGGGGIHNEGTVVMNGGTIVGCESMDNGEGAAVYSKGAGASFTMNGGSIRYNFGKSIVAAEYGATLNIKSGLIFRNVGVGNGAIRGESAEGTAVANKTTINIGEDSDTIDKTLIDTLLPESNKANMVLGTGTAGIMATNYNAEIKTPIIAYNRSIAEIATDGNGGGIYAENVNLNIKAAVIMENWAHYRGGGIDIFEEGNVTFGPDCKLLVKNNYCEYKGGGIAVRNPNTDSSKLSLTISGENVEITGNKAGYAGGIYHSYGDFNMSAGKLTNNESIGYYISTTNYNALSYFTAVDEDKNKDDVRDLNVSETEPYDGNSGDMYSASGFAKDWGYPELHPEAKSVSGYRTTQAIGYDGSVRDVSFAPRIATASKSVTGGWKITAVGSLRSSSHGGGGIYIEGDKDTNVVISGSAEITGNHALHNGGALYLTNGTVRMDGGTISGNYIDGMEHTTEGGVYYAQRTVEGQFKGSVNSSNAYNGTKNGVNNAKGGAVCINNGKFVMNGGTVDNNLILATGGDGAGVYVLQDANNTYTGEYAFEMHGGEIFNNYNKDDQGGGVYASGKVKIDATVSTPEIHDNYACDNGGGIYSDKDVDMLAGEIYNNTAHAYIGGGVYTDTGNFTMSGGKIYQNKALTRNGGGVYVRNGNFIMSGGEIFKNTALNTNAVLTNLNNLKTQYGSGGGVCIQNGAVTITGNSKIYENEATYKGGGIYMFTSNRHSGQGLKSLTIGTTDAAPQPEIYSNKVDFTSNGNTFANGNYECGGGAICVEGKDNDITINNATIHDNTVKGEWCDGGAIFVLDRGVADDGSESEEAIAGAANVTIHNATAYNNQALSDHGGFLYIKGNGNVTIDDGDFYNNYAMDNGGFAYVGSGTFNIDNDKDGDLKIHGNRAEKYVAGAIRVYDGTVNIYGGEIYDNEVTNNNSDANASERGNGGAIELITGQVNMYGGYVYNNRAGVTKNYGNGGAIAIMDTGTVNVYGGKIGVKPDGTAAGNTAKTNGGAIYVNKGNIYIGKATCDGTSDETHNTLEPTASACGHPIVANNTAVNGGALYSESGTTTFYCGEMTANTASNKGGGMYVADGIVTITNASIKGNSAAEEYFGDALYMTGGTVKYTENTVFMNQEGTSTGVVVAGGTLEQTVPPTTALISVYFKDRESEKVVKGFTVPAGTDIVLPDGNDIFGDYPGHTFIGWQYPDVSTYVKDDGAWYLRGAQITTEDNSRYVEGADANTMTIYGVWANDTNTITYYKSNAESSTDVYTGTGYKTSYNYQTSDDDKFTLPTPEAIPGYTFTNWTRAQGTKCPVDCNANWNIPAGGDTKDPGAVFNAKSKFGNIHFVANWSTTITYKAVGGGKVDGALQKTEAITVGSTTTVAEGATAAPDLNYVFMGWYTDEDCTQKVAEPTVTKYVPTTNGGSGKGYYENLTYYAKFELDVASLTIKTTGADANQTFVFTVEGRADHGGEQINMQVFVFSGADGNGSVTIEHIPAGTYTVYENNCKDNNPHQGNTWTWRYTNTEDVNSVVDTEMNGVETEVDTVTYSYGSRKGISNWLSGLSTKLYRLVSGN